MLIIEKVKRLRSVYKAWLLGGKDREIVIDLVEDDHACIAKLEGRYAYDMVVVDMGLTGLDALQPRKNYVNSVLRNLL